MVNSKRINEAIIKLQQNETENQIKDTSIYKSLENIKKINVKRRKKSIEVTDYKLDEFAFKSKKPKKTKKL